MTTLIILLIVTQCFLFEVKVARGYHQKSNFRERKCLQYFWILSNSLFRETYSLKSHHLTLEYLLQIM